MCGYYAYPANIAQIIQAIIDGKCPEVVLRCYTADPGRKVLMSYYVYCLDAWIKNAPLATVIAELSQRDSLGKEWNVIAPAIYRVLGDKNQTKLIAVERLIHRLRWWIKSLIWFDDKRDRFMLDTFSGDIRGDEEKWGAYGNSPYGDPYFTELQLPYVKVMETKLREQLPDGDNLITRIHSTWLCAPKVFRYLERLIIEIGNINSQTSHHSAASFLQCENTYPDYKANRNHFQYLTGALRAWLKGNVNAYPDLGETTPIKHWLVHILLHKLNFHAKYEENFGKYMGLRHHGKSGTKLPQYHSDGQQQ